MRRPPSPKSRESPRSTPPGTSTLAGQEQSGSLIIFAPSHHTFSSFVVTNNFGLFTERDYVNALRLFEDRSPDDIELSEVARFSAGDSKATMEHIHALDNIAHDYKPDSITAVERSTPVRDVLSLMLGNKLLYAPVTENKRPIDVVSLRDINLFLAPKADDK